MFECEQRRCTYNVLRIYKLACIQHPASFCLQIVRTRYAFKINALASNLHKVNTDRGMRIRYLVFCVLKLWCKRNQKKRNTSLVDPFYHRCYSVYAYLYPPRILFAYFGTYFRIVIAPP